MFLFCSPYLGAYPGQLTVLSELVPAAAMAIAAGWI